MAAPEGVVPIAKIRIPGLAQQIYQGVEDPVASSAQPGDVAAASAFGEPRALRVVRAIQERPDESRDLGRIGRAVGIDHDDYVTGRRRESASQGVTLAAAVLRDDPYLGPQPACGGQGVVHRVAVHHDDLVQPGGQPGKDTRQVTCLVESGNDHRHLRHKRAAGRLRPSRPARVIPGRADQVLTLLFGYHAGPRNENQRSLESSAGNDLGNDSGQCKFLITLT